MIDELPTRAALSVAALLLLGTGLSVLRLADGDAARESVEALAAHIARQIDAVGHLAGEAVFRAGVGVDGPLALPPTVAGARYRVEVRASSVTVLAGGVAAAAALSVPVLPFPPDEAEYTSEGISAKSADVVAIDVGGTFLVERTERLVDGVPAHRTFVHLPH